MSGMRRAAGVFVGTLTLLAASMVTASSASAVAQSCSHSWSNVSDDASYVAGSDVNYRTGPHASCDSLGQAQYDQYVYLHCWTTGDYVVNTSVWWHLRLAGTQRQGWMSSYYVLTGGANATAENRC